MPSDSSGEGAKAEVRFAYETFDAFQRENPPGATSSSDLWEFSAQFIDFGNALFVKHNDVRKGRELRDLVMAAILRRGLITTESILSLLWHGLAESAVALQRTLLDIELNAKLIVADPNDRMVRRFAAYHYFAAKRHGQKMASDSATRSMLQTYEGAFEEMLDTVRRNDGWFKAQGFDDIRTEITAGRPWHGYESVAAAFKAVGGDTDYYQTYDLATFFVHANNIDFDFDQIADGKIMLKSPLTANERALLPILGTALAHLKSIMDMYVTDKPMDLEKGVIVADNGYQEEVSSVEAMGILLAQILSKYDPSSA